jgi:DNA-binding response OmpR family regulator
MKILLCEDDPNIATITKLSLLHMGQHDVTHVADGENALVQAKTGLFDLILLDEMMPKMSGVDVCRSLSIGGFTKSPVIFMSANPQSARVNEFSNVAVGYIPKPFDPMTLNTQILEILKNNHRVAS